MSDADFVLAGTRAWVERAVVGLRLCPFAPAPLAAGRVRFVVSPARDVDTLLAELVAELNRLGAAPPEEIETTLLIHPHVLADFLDYNDFLDAADRAIAALRFDGVVQIASFHPDYCFADSEPDDIANATNRSPYPVLQLLREASIAAGLARVAQPDAIYEANIAAMERLGGEGWAALQRQCLADADAAAAASGEDD